MINEDQELINDTLKFVFFFTNDDIFHILSGKLAARKDAKSKEHETKRRAVSSTHNSCARKKVVEMAGAILVFLVFEVIREIELSTK